MYNDTYVVRTRLANNVDICMHMLLAFMRRIQISYMQTQAPVQ